MSKVSRRERQVILHRQKQRQRLIWGTFGLGVILIVVAFVWSRSDQVAPADDRFDADTVALGRQVYDEKCAVCHGEDLEGEVDWRKLDPTGVLKAPPHDETGHTWHHADAYLIESIKLGGARLPADVGISPMPAYEAVLSDAEITAVLTFIKSQWPTDILAAQAQR
jgi:mono/diheme cytochrome c family protein